MDMVQYWNRLEALSVTMMDEDGFFNSRYLAAQELSAAIQSNGVNSLEEAAIISRIMSQGLQRCPLEDRPPATVGKATATDVMVVALADVLQDLGKQLMHKANRARTDDEKTEVERYLTEQGLDQMCAAFVADYRAMNLQLSDLSGHVSMLAHSTESIKQSEDAVLAGQSARIDLPVYILSQAYLAVSERMHFLAVHGTED